MICHNDFAPYNLVFRDGLPVGAIDFEAASPGPRAWDLAYLAYRLVPLAHPVNPDLPPQPDPEARLARLCAAYGDIDPAAVLALVPPRLRELAATAPPPTPRSTAPTRPLDPILARPSTLAARARG